jgi:hypothetical protein
MALGRHVKLERQISDRESYCRFLLTGELFLANIQPVHRELFAGHDDTQPGWCPFLRRERGDVFVCCCYPSRPAFCRSFRCATARILDRTGNPAGTIKGRRSLETSDPVLREVWDRSIAGIVAKTDVDWLEQAGFLIWRSGYRIEPLE